MDEECLFRPFPVFFMLEYFTIKKINNNIYKITEAWFKEHANLYLIKGDKFNLLVDAGLGVFNIKEFLNKQGFKNIKVILTHSHFDHAGGIKHFLPNELLINKKILKNLQDKKLWGLEYLEANDFNKKILKKLTDKSAEEICKNYNISIFKLLENNISKINLRNFCFKLIYSPGHSNDSFIYYDEKNKILITGDALYDGKIYIHLINSNKKKFKESLKKIVKLDFNLVLTGHNKILNKIEALGVIKKWSKEL